MPETQLIQDALKLADNAEHIAHRVEEVKDVPEVIKASILNRILEIKDMMNLLASQLTTFTRGPGNSTPASSPKPNFPSLHF